MTAFAPRPAARHGVVEATSILASLVRARLELRATKRGARVRCFGTLYIPQREGIIIGQRAVFLRGPVPTALRCARGGELVIGERSVCNYGVDIAASRSVRIGSDCLIGSYVHIRDDDGRRTSPVVIGNGVWLAHGAVIEPGAIVGDGAVVATMAVVSGNVPPRSIAAGNPARCLPLDAEAGPEAPSMSDSDRTGTRAGEVRAAIIEWLDDTRLFGETATLITSDTMALREAGLLDSLGTVELVSMLEERFGVVLERAHAVRPETQSLSAFVELVMHAGPLQA